MFFDKQVTRYRNKATTCKGKAAWNSSYNEKLKNRVDDGYFLLDGVFGVVERLGPVWDRQWFVYD